MDLYIHPMSTTSRPVMLFCAEAGIKAEQKVVDLFTGEHLGERYRALNPSCLVPMIAEGEFRLTESSAILKYLAEKAGHAAYPTELRARARVNEQMDWFNSNLYRSFGYDLIYPQVFPPPHKRRSDEAQAAILAHGQEQSKKWFEVLDKSFLGGGQPYLGGAQASLADYLGSGFVAIGAVIGCDFAAYPNVRRWLSQMRELKNWGPVWEAFDGWAASQKGKDFVRI